MAESNSNHTWPPGVLPFRLIGQTRPRHYGELITVLWNNRNELPYAWNVLNHGVCDGCSLGPYGLRDNVVDGVHLCMTRLKLLKLNTMAALEMAVMSDVHRLRKLNPQQLRNLGRLPFPMIRRRGEAAFSRITWDEALGAVGNSIHDTAPHQLAFVASSRSLTNEVYYVFQKLARVLGTNNVDLCSPQCHAASVAGLKTTLGIGAPTCSLADLIGTELLIIFGTELAKDQPVITKYLHFAKKAGTRILVVSPTREYDLERYWAPSVASGALFGAKLMDEFYQVTDGGNVACINGVIKSLITSGRIDKSYVDKHTAGFAELKAALDQQSWPMLEKSSGVPRGQIQRFADLYGQAKSAVLVSSMEVTQQESGVDDVKAIANLALARGMLGRKKCGIMPIGGGSGGQGGSDCGAEPDKFPGGFAVNDDNARRFSNLWYHPVPSSPGLSLPQMIAAAHCGDIKFLYSIGGNSFEPIADADFVGDALKNIPLRVHQSIVLDASMLHDADEAVVLLPAQTRYEQRSGGTTNSSERRIRFTPEISGHRIGECLPQWEIPVLLGQMSMPNGAKLFPFADTQAIREEMSRVMPMFQGIEKLNKEGDQLQWGGPFLFKDGFTAMPDNRARFTVLVPN